MRLLVDMNLSPDWLPIFQRAGWDACHWASIGAGNAPDPELRNGPVSMGMSC